MKQDTDHSNNATQRDTCWCTVAKPHVAQCAWFGLRMLPVL